MRTTFAVLDDDGTELADGLHAEHVAIRIGRGFAIEAQRAVLVVGPSCPAGVRVEPYSTAD